MSKIAPQHDGLKTSPCPVPRSAIKPSISSCPSSLVVSVWMFFFLLTLMPLTPILSHALMACGVLTTDVPCSSSPTSHCTHVIGTPSLAHAIRIIFFDTLSNALVMSQELVCNGVLCSIASSIALINISDAVIVFWPERNPCWLCCITPWSFHTLNIRCSISLLHSFLTASTNMSGLRFPTLTMSCSFLGIGTIHLCFHHSGI